MEGGLVGGELGEDLAQLGVEGLVDAGCVGLGGQDGGEAGRQLEEAFTQACGQAGGLAADLVDADELAELLLQLEFGELGFGCLATSSGFEVAGLVAGWLVWSRGAGCAIEASQASADFSGGPAVGPAARIGCPLHVGNDRIDLAVDLSDPTALHSARNRRRVALSAPRVLGFADQL
ncbi:MAG: hypothetical protein ACK4F7_00465 [Inhella sp.]